MSNYVFHKNGEFVGEFSYGKTGHELIKLFGLNLPELYSYFLRQGIWYKTTGKPYSEGESRWRNTEAKDVPDYIHTQMLLMGYDTNPIK